MLTMNEVDHAEVRVVGVDEDSCKRCARNQNRDSRL